MKHNLHKLLDLDCLTEDQEKDFNRRSQLRMSFEKVMMGTVPTGMMSKINGNELASARLKTFLQSQLFLKFTKISTKSYLDFKNNIPLDAIATISIFENMSKLIKDRQQMEKNGTQELDNIYSLIMSYSLSRLYDEYSSICNEDKK